jgi:hypothetical protein
MNYTDKCDFADKCEHMYCRMCKRRNKLRNCLRPLCCGYCPTNDECEGICTPIKDKEEETNG